MSEWLYCELIPTTDCQLCYKYWCIHNPKILEYDDEMDNQNGCVEKLPVNHDKMFIITDFVKELKKQVPGMKLDQSHVYKLVKEIEGILDNIE